MTAKHHDVFRPHSEPARTIYDAFQKEAEKRDGMDVDDWILAEREAVWKAARDYAQQHGMRIPTMEEVERAEDQACCHTDYGLKWAIGVAEKMR
jgi:hypothetical protein